MLKIWGAQEVGAGGRSKNEMLKILFWVERALQNSTRIAQL